MIHINLLPAALIPKRRNILPYAAVAMLAVMFTGWIVSAQLAVRAERKHKTATRTALQAELDSYAETVRQVQNLIAEQDRLAQKETAIAEITAGRTVWSHDMYTLAALVPEEIWLRDMRLGERRRPVMVEKPNPNSARGQPPTITVPEIRTFPAIVLTGYALSPYREEGVRLVGELITNMKQDDTFATHFVEPEMKTIERERFEDHTVMQFVMDVEIR